MKVVLDERLEVVDHFLVASSQVPRLVGEWLTSRLFLRLHDLVVADVEQFKLSVVLEDAHELLPVLEVELRPAEVKLFQVIALLEELAD